MGDKPKKGIALILEGKGDSDEGEEVDSSEAELEAMTTFDAADSSEARLAALKDIIKSCMTSGEYKK